MALFDKLKKWFQSAPPKAAEVTNPKPEPLPDLEALKAAGEKITAETKALTEPKPDAAEKNLSLRDAFLQELRSIPTNRDQRTRNDILDDLKKISPPEKPPK